MAAGQTALPGLEGPDPSFVRRMRRQSDATTTALRRNGRIEPADAGMIALARTLADLIDDELAAGDVANKWLIARLAGEWRAAMGELRGDSDAGWNADLARFFHGDVSPADRHPAQP